MTLRPVYQILGHWYNGLPIGPGAQFIPPTVEQPHVRVYEGDLVAGHRHGLGVLWCDAAERKAGETPARRRAYCGEWIEGTRHGSGVGGSFHLEIADGDMRMEVEGRLGDSFRVVEGWQVIMSPHMQY